MTIRVLHVAHDHPAWTPGGTELAAHGLARAMNARPGVEARLLVAATPLHRPDAPPGALEALGEDFVLATGAYDRFTMLRQDGDAWVSGLARALAALRPHVAHFHGIDRLGAEIVAATRRIAPETRIVMTLHDYQLICPNDGLLLTTREAARCLGAAPDRCRRCHPEIAAARHALRKAHLHALLDPVDIFLAPSAFLRERHLDWGIAPEKLRLMPNAVDWPAAPPSPPRARPDRFAFFGNVARHKGVLTLLEAAARLARAEARIRVDIHGGLGWADATFRSDFHAALAAAAPIAQHLGPYDRAEVVARMRRADWIVVPSIWWENAPLVILEAKAAGRPVICSGIGGMAELVADRVDGLHVPPGDAASLAETMSEAAEDPALWSRLAPAARPPEAAAQVDAHLVLYRGLMERAPA